MAHHANMALQHKGDTEEQMLNRFQASRKPGFADISLDSKWSDKAAALYDDYLKTYSDPQGLEAKFHGPGLKGTPEEIRTAFVHMATEGAKGRQHQEWMRAQREGAEIDPVMRDNAMGINTVTRRVMTGQDMIPSMAPVVLLSDPADCQRIAEKHLKKQPRMSSYFFGSIIATTDNDYWRKQRNHLNTVFLPGASLAKIFPTSLARARKCTDHMNELAHQQGKNGVQVHEFFLHEAQAQLQMALFGMDENFMESTNADLRKAFSGSHEDDSYLTNIGLEMMKKVGGDERFATAHDSLESGKPVWGPLSKAVDEAAKDPDLNMNLLDQFGNMMLILFAGHDTTGHTMTWLAYEMARNPHLQTRLQAEVDALFDEIGDRDMTYTDMKKMPFLTQCVMETLRKWNAVPNGTFRELMSDEYVTGAGGKKVLLKKGTYVQVITWMRQRNPKLWKDPMEFNPDREWAASEIWNNMGFAATNPATERFSPFTYAPRHCLGMNFAQMEMRTILANVFRRFSFSLSEPYRDENIHEPLEVAMGTSGPRDLTPEGMKASAERCLKGMGPKLGMWLRVTPRDGVGAKHQARL